MFTRRPTKSENCSSKRKYAPPRARAEQNCGQVCRDQHRVGRDVHRVQHRLGRKPSKTAARYAATSTASGVTYIACSTASGAASMAASGAKGMSNVVNSISSLRPRGILRGLEPGRLLGRTGRSRGELRAKAKNRNGAPARRVAESLGEWEGLLYQPTWQNICLSPAVAGTLDQCGQLLA